MEERRGCSWRVFFVIIFGIVACAGVTTLVGDAMCYDILSKRLPLYPSAEITFERASIRRYGMGETILILDSDDPSSVVREWYGRYTGSLARQVQEDNARRVFFGFTKAAWSVTTAEDGTGSQILLSGACMAG